METIEVVIKIPKEVYDETLENGFLQPIYGGVVAKCFEQGTVLPKGHDDLISRKETLEILMDNLNKIRMVNNSVNDMIRRDERIDCIGELRHIPTIIEADKEKPNMMQQTMGFFKNLYLQNKDEIDRTAKEFYSKRNELTCIDLLEELRQQIWDITSKHLDSQRYALIRKADVLDIINQHLSDMQRNIPTVIEADREKEDDTGRA